MYTIDASVHLNAINPSEASSSISQALLRKIFTGPSQVFSPTLLIVEVAAAAARAFDNPEQGNAIAQAIRLLPGQIWVPLDEALAVEASRLGAEFRLRGADAVYAAVARRSGTTLVTLDRQQLERLSATLPVKQPGEALQDFG